MARTSSDATPALSPALVRVVDGLKAGRGVALARAISIVEDERPGFQALLHALLSEATRAASRVGITGPPGAGKSSLVAALCRGALSRGETVGVVAVDPTSPYSGGALLGDRIRMNELALEPGIFIRSMASRGSLGGLATTTKEVIDVMDAYGFPRILVETVGVGQTELEITSAADTVVVVLVPESGDGIQAMKAGLMEIADIFVVNKSDRPGADRLVKELRTAMNLRSRKARAEDGPDRGDVPAHHGVDLSRVDRAARSAERSPAATARPDAVSPEPPPDAWRVPVLQTVAHAGEGIDDLANAIEAHRVWLEASGELEIRRRERTARRIRDVLDRELRRRALTELRTGTALEDALDRISRREATPYSVAGEMLERLGLPVPPELP